MSKAKVVTTVVDALLNGGRKSMQAEVAQKVATKQLAQKTVIPTIEAGVAEPSINLAKDYAAKVVNRYQTGGRGPLRANRPTKTQAAYSTIYSEAQNMQKAYPDLQGEIENWVRGGYAWARDKSVGTAEQPLKGYKPFEGPDGRSWRLKSKGSHGQGYRLSAIDKGKLKGYGKLRTSRERPWTNDDEMTKLLRALTKVGKAHKFNQLIKIMKDDFKIGMDKIKASGNNMSKGHLISLDNGGLDVAENFMPQQFRNTTKIVNGKRVTVKGNPAQQADSTIEFANGRGLDNWDDYVRLKLSLL
jgi:DNA-binding XRE family transcriptional regulator